VVLRPTRHKIGRHFRDVSPSQSQTKPNTTKTRIHQSKKCTTTQNKHKKLKPGLVAFYDIQPGNGAGLFSKGKISNEKVKKKGCGEAYDINKQRMYIVPKSKIEPRLHYAPEPAQGIHV